MEFDLNRIPYRLDRKDHYYVEYKRVVDNNDDLVVDKVVEYEIE